MVTSSEQGYIRHVPNVLSISRVPLVFAVTLMFFTTYKYRALTAFVLFVVASLTDWLDGATARKFNVVTTFGMLFDALADKILTIGVFTAFLTLNLYPQWFVFGLLMIISREFAVSGLRMAAAKANFIMAAEKGGKIKTAVYMVSACCTLAAEAMGELGFPELACRLVKVTGYISFLVSSLLAVQSGWTYFSKYGHLLYADDEKRSK